MNKTFAAENESRQQNHYMGLRSVDDIYRLQSAHILVGGLV